VELRNQLSECNVSKDSEEASAFSRWHGTAGRAEKKECPTQQKRMPNLVEIVTY
jgi:hypothetical protein